MRMQDVFTLAQTTHHSDMLQQHNSTLSAFLVQQHHPCLRRSCSVIATAAPHTTCRWNVCSLTRTLCVLLLIPLHKLLPTTRFCRCWCEHMLGLTPTARSWCALAPHCISTRPAAFGRIMAVLCCICIVNYTLSVWCGCSRNFDVGQPWGIQGTGPLAAMQQNHCQGWAALHWCSIHICACISHFDFCWSGTMAFGHRALFCRK